MEKTAKLNVASEVKTYLIYLRRDVVHPHVDARAVASRDVEIAVKEMPEDTYALKFFDQKETPNGKETIVGCPKNWSPTYYLGGTVYSLKQVEDGVFNEGIYKGALAKKMKSHTAEHVVQTRFGTIELFYPGDKIIALPSK